MPVWGLESSKIHIYVIRSWCTSQGQTDVVSCLYGTACCRSNALRMEIDSSNRVSQNVSIGSTLLMCEFSYSLVVRAGSLRFVDEVAAGVTGVCAPALEPAPIYLKKKTDT